MRKALRLGLQAAVSALILWALFRQARPARLLDVVSGGQWWPLLLAAALVPVVIFLRALRWHWLLHDAGARHVGLRQSYGLVFIGTALNLVVPGGMGELARAYYGHRATGTREEMLSTALVDKLVALLAVCVLGAGAAGASGQWALCAWGGAFAVAFAAPLLFPRLIPWGVANWALFAVARKRLDAGKLLRSSRFTPAQHARALGLSALATVASVVVAYLVLRALIPGVGFARVFAAWPFFTLARLIPVALGGFGTSDSALVLLLGPPLYPAEAVLIGSLTTNALLVLLPAAVGLVCLWCLPPRAAAERPQAGDGRIGVEGAR
ncbi:MAG: flippase-like domain-containing protein [Planctomycetes bacterium]|nr:flippase-like domain-containing protein [Planctomycetota bacterium]